MRLSYHHANPRGGNESFLLRFEDGEQSTCVLVDAGDHIDPNQLLFDDDHLAAICLTHAHLDHYQSLSRCHRDETPIYTSPATATILDDVFDVAKRDYDVQTAATTTAQITPIDSWTTITPELRVHPLPAGHAPGAIGYLFEYTDDGDRHSIVATGDFTCRRVAGFPGFDADALFDVDVLFLTVATNENFSEPFSTGLAQALQRAHSGAKTLVATSGLLGVHVAYLLSNLIREFEYHVPIRVVGQVAKHYTNLDYDCPGVEVIEEFSDPDECVAPGTITIAGPEVPHERSSGRLFGLLRDDPGACVVQLTRSGEDPLREGQCTIHAHEVVNHPSRTTLDTVHDAIDPTHTIVVHRHRGAGEEFNDWSSYVWSPTDGDEYTLYADGVWRPPPWMNDTEIRRQSDDATVGRYMDESVLDSLSPPTLERHDSIDFTEEGIDMDHVEQIVTQADVTAGASQQSGAGRDRSGHSDETTDSQSAPIADDHETMVTENANSDEEVEEQRSPERLIRTIRTPLDGIDPAIQTAVSEGDLPEDEVRDIYRLLQYDPEDVANVFEAVTGGDDDSETTETSEMEDDPATDTAESTSQTQHPAAADNSSGDTNGSDPPPDADQSDTTVDAAVNDPPDADVTSDEATSSTDGPGATGDAESEPVAVTLPPVTAALATHATADGDDIGVFISDAVQAYLADLLHNTPPADHPGGDLDDLAISGPPALRGALDDALARDDRFDTTSEFLSTSIAETLAPDYDRAIDVPGLEPYLPLLDAIIDTDHNEHASRSEVIATAIHVYLDQDDE